VEILKYLVGDARLSQRAIARSVGMSPPAIADRIARLENLGVIEGYHAKVNYQLLDRAMTIVVGVSCERSSGQRELAQTLLDIPEVERVDLVTGASDLQVRMRVRDQTHFNGVFFDRLLTIPGIRHTDTAFALYTFEPDSFALQVLSSLSQQTEEDETTTDS
jgi:DNA-binding Lrp family transcriptional regulator